MHLKGNLKNRLVELVQDPNLEKNGMWLKFDTEAP